MNGGWHVSGGRYGPGHIAPMNPVGPAPKTGGTEGFSAPQPETDPSGAWVVYGHDNGPYAIALFATADMAARYAAQAGYGFVAKWSFGTEFRDAIAEWEARS